MNNEVIGRSLALLFGWKLWAGAAAVGAVGLGMLAIPVAVVVAAQGNNGSGAGGGSAANTTGISDAVPAQYRDTVTRAGTVCDGITAPLIAAQIGTESGWDPSAASHAGAQGISQFMPPTWAAHGLDGDGDDTADPWNPADAIYSQAHYMCHLLADIDSLLAAGAVHGDRIELTLAAYNAGTGAVEAAGGIPHNGETETYVDRIMATVPTYTGDEGGAIPLVGADAQTTDAIKWAKGIAEDDSHGYVWGGEGPHYDCSGLTAAFMRMRGVILPHQANSQARLGTTVPESQAVPGDLIFWSTDGGTYYYHVAIYLGGGQMISADSEASGINVEPIWGRNQTIIFKHY